MAFVEKTIRKILEEKKIPYKLFEHEPVYTSEEASIVRKEPLESGIKSLILKTREDEFVLMLVAGNKRADLKRIAKVVGTKKIKLASHEEVFKKTGCKVGSVPPFGHATQFKTYMDKGLLKNELINFSAGSHTKSIKMKTKDLIELINPVFV